MHKVLVSACLLGQNVRYDGGNTLQDHAGLQQLLADGHTISEVSEITGKHRNTVSAWIDKIGE